MDEQNQVIICDHVVKAHKLCLELNDTLMLISSSNSTEDILHKVVKASREALGSESARIAMRENDHWVIRYVNNLPQDLIGRSFTDNELPHAALAMTTRKPVAIDDAFHDTRTNVETMESLGIRSVMVIPLIQKDVVIGTVLYGYHSRTVSFTEPEIDYAKRLAIGVDLAVEQARLHQELEESKKLTDALLQIDSILYSAQDYDTVMNNMLQVATDAIGAESGVIFSKEDDRWRVRYEYQMPLSLIGRTFSNTEVMHTAITAKTRRSLVEQDVLNNPEIDQKFVEMFGIRSLLDFPLIVQGEVIGDLTFHYHSKPIPFNERQVEFVRKLQIAITLALESIQLINAAKQSESQLKEAETLGKSGYFHYDIATKKTTWSEGMFSIFARDPALGVPTVEELVSIYFIVPGPEAVEELLEKEETGEFDGQILRDGVPCFLHFIIRPLKNDKGEIIVRFGTVQDITDRKRIEEALQEANGELEAFNYTVAHDLRKPLTVINGYCQILKEICSDKLDEQCKAYLEEAYEGTLNMNRLIDAILDFSRVAHAEPKREPIDLTEKAKSVASELKRAEPERKVMFRIAEGLTAEADRELLRIVLANLFGNAWKYTSKREEAVIEFGATEIKGTWAFFVRDNGIGFDPAEAGKLFDPFQRLEPAREVGGQGIGLATVARIIERHGGKVWAEGEPGEGATFWFSLGER